MNAFLARLGDPPVLLDGAWATELQQLGLPPNTPADSWNLTHPDAVLDLARAYVAAGSRILLTNTFRANPASLAEVGLQDQVARINQEGARLSLKAAEEGTDVAVFGSIGPILYRGPIPADRRSSLRRAFSVQAQRLVDQGVMGLVLETFGDLAEAELALDAALGATRTVIASFVLDPIAGLAPRSPAPIGSRRRERPITIEVVAKRMAALGASAVGANCVAPGAAAPIVAQLRSASPLPAWIKPNTAGAGRAPLGPIGFAEDLAPAIRAGAGLIGGCCGATPAHIRALGRLRNLSPNPGRPARPATAPQGPGNPAEESDPPASRSEGPPASL